MWACAIDISASGCLGHVHPRAHGDVHRDCVQTCVDSGLGAFAIAAMLATGLHVGNRLLMIMCAARSCAAGRVALLFLARIDLSTDPSSHTPWSTPTAVLEFARFSISLLVLLY